MSEQRPSWRQKLDQLLRKRSGTALVEPPLLAEPPKGESPRVVVQQTDIPAPRPISINLGVDFGTSFTKACYRLSGFEQSGVIPFGKVAGNPVFFLPSVLEVISDGRFRFPHGSDDHGVVERIRYPKMFLSGQGVGNLPAVLARLGDQAAREAWKHLSAWYLAEAIHRARMAVETIERAQIGRRPVEWSYNLGAPVEYCESPAMKVFREVLVAASRMSPPGESALSLGQLSDAYRAAVEGVDLAQQDCHVQPELAMTLTPFATRYQAPRGIYGIFDIGGGTLDGAVFTFERQEGQPAINILTSRVAPLGLEVIATDLASQEDASAVMSALMTGDPHLNGTPLPLGGTRRSIITMVAEQVIVAKEKVGTGWFSSNPYFPVFICGGGQASRWYAQTIIDTHRVNGHARCDIPPYRREKLEIPSDLKLNGLRPQDYHRHLVAFGLSYLYGQEPRVIGFPLDNPRKQKARTRCDDRLLVEQVEKYGKRIT